MNEGRRDSKSSLFIDFDRTISKLQQEFFEPVKIFKVFQVGMLAAVNVHVLS